jgi:hypothetical protein
LGESRATPTGLGIQKVDDEPVALEATGNEAKTKA